MKNISIKFKLILLFITYIAIKGASKINYYFTNNTEELFIANKNILKSTTSQAINDSIKALDKKSQESLEKLSVSLASSVADFLYERDNDILFLSQVKYLQRCCF